MAQSARDKNLESRSARLKLAKGKRTHARIGPGLVLIYRRTEAGFGTWSAKVEHDGRYTLHQLGTADDLQEGAGVLTFYQAQEKARELAEQAKRNRGIIIAPLTVGEAAQRYLLWFRQHRKSFVETESAIRAHVLPSLGEIRLDALTSPRIRDWLDKLAEAPVRVRASKLAKPAYGPAPKSDDAKRARRASANRIFNVLRAILNRAFADGLVADDTAWRRVKPFAGADEPRIRFLTEDEATRLSNACAPDLRALVQAALLTGGRFGELVAMRARDIDLEGARVYVAQSKSGKPRYVPLNPEGVSLFRSVSAGKVGEALLFTKADGTAWGKNHHVRGLAAACKTAKIHPVIRFHELRHSYASLLVQAGVPLLDVSKLLGHADTRITSRHYAHLAAEHLADAVTRLPSFGVVTGNVAPMRRKKSDRASR